MYDVSPNGPLGPHVSLLLSGCRYEMNTRSKFQRLERSAKCFINAMLNAPLVCAPEISTRPANDSGLTPERSESCIVAFHSLGSPSPRLLRIPLDPRTFVSLSQMLSSSDCTAAAAVLVAQAEPR